MQVNNFENSKLKLSMWKNIFLIIIRTLRRNMAYSILNFFGLSTAFASVILISSLWLKDEFTFNQYHEKLDKIQRVIAHHSYSDGISTSPAAPGTLADFLRNNNPEFNAARVNPTESLKYE